MSLSSNQVQEEERWEAPERAVFKANFNASFSSQTHLAVGGCVIRNSEGLVMGSCTYPFVNIRDPTTVEALACQKAV